MLLQQLQKPKQQQWPTSNRLYQLDLLRSLAQESSQTAQQHQV
jgi:hypothetical protein